MEYNSKTIVWITTQFEAFHKWERAPDDVAFLRNYHRHIFYVKIGIEVKHEDRDVEFFQFKRKVDEYIEVVYERHKLFNTSCEMIAKKLFNTFQATFVEVSEDGENGAIVERI